MKFNPLLPRTALSVMILTGVFCVLQADAQVVNDPAESIIMNGASRFAPVRPEEKKQIENAPAMPLDLIKGELKEQRSLGEAEPLPPTLEPELDMQKDDEAQAAPPPSGEPLKARAVMVDITSNTLNYDTDRDVYIATGSVHMVISEQNSELYAEKMTYDQNQNLVIAEGTVTIVKDGQKTHGSFAKIDLGRKSALINDYQANVEKVRIKAKNAFVNAKYVQYENGSIVISPSMLKAFKNNGRVTDEDKDTAPRKASAEPDGETGTQASASTRYVHEEDLTSLAASQELERTDYEDEEGEGGGGSEAAPSKSMFSLKVKDFDIHRSQSGYNKIYWRWPQLYFKGHKIGTMPSAEFSFDEPSQTLEYLGPDVGYDPDYGGFYMGPGWDFQVGEHGSLRVSPLVSYGGGGRRIRNGSTFERVSAGPGVGGIVHYRDPKTRLDFGYNSHIGDPVLLGQRFLFDGKTRVLASANEDYISGFLGYERPRLGLMVSDSRKVFEKGKFRVDSYASAGYFKDEFYPNFEDDFFVKPKEGKPIYAGRAQLQAEIGNTEPLLRVGKFLSFGVRGNVALAGYTTGDFVGLVRGGPTMNLSLGRRFNSSLRYFFAATAGESPFVFDSYYRGRQNLIWGNSVRVNKYLTLGMRSDMNLTRDNDKNALFTGNQLYMLVGPDEVKMNLAYDVIRKRSYFGLNFYPGKDGRNIDFENMRIFQPDNYNSINMAPQQ